MADKLAIDLLASLRERKVQLSSEQGALAYKAPKGVLSAADIEDIRRHKSAVLELLKAEKLDQHPTPLEARTTDGPVAASFAQQGLWFLDRKDGGTTYHLPIALRFEGQLDVEALRGALQALVQRHEILRTSFIEADGKVLQIIREPWTFELPMLDVSALDDGSRGPEMMRLVLKSVETRFDLSRGPLFRAALVRESTSTHVIVITMHHIVGDASSVTIVVSELGMLYTALSKGSGNPLTPLRIQYADFAQWQQQRHHGNALAKLLSYWKEQLRDAPVLELPVDSVDSQLRSDRGGVHQFSLPAASASSLLELARACRSTSYMALLAIFQLLLSLLSGQRDVVVASPASGRGAPDSQLLIGCFINLVLMRVRVDERLSFRQFLTRVRDTTLDAYENQDLPFDRVIAELQADRGGGAALLSRVAFSFYQSATETGADLDFGAIKAQPFAISLSPPAKNDLSLTMVQSGQRVYGTFSYPLDVFDPETIAGFARRLIRLIEQVTANADKPIVEIDLTLPPPVVEAPVVRRLTNHQRARWSDVGKYRGADGDTGISCYVEIAGPLDMSAFKQAVDEVVQSTAALRLHIHADQHGLGKQEILPSRDLDVEVHDVSSEPNPIAAANEAIERWKEQPIELGRTVPFRYCLLRLSSEQSYWYTQYHPLVMDEAGSALVIERVARVYSGLVSGNRIELRRDDEAYLQYLHLDSEYRFSAHRLSDASYWQETRGQSSAVSLSAWTRSPSLRKPHSVTRHINASVVRVLRARAGHFSADFGQLLIVGAALYVHRVTEKARVCLGWLTHGRLDHCAADLAGAFASLAPIASELSAQDSVGAFVRRTLSGLESALAHGRYAPEGLARKLGSVVEDEPPFNVTINASQKIVSSACFAGARASLKTNAPRGRDIAISLQYAADDAEVTLTVDANPELYEVWELEAHLTRLAGFLEAFALSHADDSAHHLQLVCAQEQEALRTFSGGHWIAPSERFLHEQVEDQVRRNPGAIAVMDETRSLTYAQLESRAESLASFLRARGVGPDSLVAVCVERGLDLIVALLGTLKAGGAYVPLDPAYPKDRLQYMLTDAQPCVVLTQEKLIAQLETTVERIAIDARWSEIECHAGLPFSAREAGLTQAHLAYVIYTSGSTGTPKGVMVEQANMLNHCSSVLVEFELSPRDRVLQFASVCFDASVEEIWPTLMAGACLVLCRPAEQSLTDFTQEICTNGVSVLNLPTTYWHLWAAHVDSATLEKSALRLVVVGGEKVHAESLSRWPRPATRRIQWLNTYGPTETTVTCTVFRDEGASHREIPIGRPIANSQIYILRGDLCPSPIGVAGEIFIAGAGVARGYLNQPQLTSQRFVANCVAADVRTRMYRSGDIGRWRADGTIEYVGRSDHQVKIRGHRIELGEIEVLFSQHPDIEHSAVVAREEDQGQRRLVGYFTPRAAIPVSSEELQAFLGRRLPEYMVPRTFIALQHWPLTPSGKLNRKALPSPETESLNRNQFQSPEGSVEELVARLWRELLRVSQVGRDDSFFKLGGHSLLAVVLVNRLKAEGIVLPVMAVFQNPTLQALAAHIAATQLQKAAERGLVEMKRVDKEAAIYLVPDVITGEVLHLQRLAEHLPYTIYGLMLDVTKVLTSVEELAAHHVATIRRRQPHGPYRVIGYSMAGLVAYEIAQQLQHAGEVVDFLGLIDTHRSTSTNDRSGQISEVTALLIFLKERFKHLQESEMRELEALGDID